MLVYQRVKPQELVYSSMVCGKCTVTLQPRRWPGDAALGCKQLSTGCLALIPRPLTNWGLQALSELVPTSSSCGRSFHYLLTRSPFFMLGIRTFRVVSHAWFTSLCANDSHHFTSPLVPQSYPHFRPHDIYCFVKKRAPQNPVISLDVRYMKSQNNKFWGEIPHFQTPVAPFEVCARADSQKSHYESSRGSCVTRLQWWEICVVMGTPKSSKNWLV